MIFYILVAVFFVLGYVAIALEHPLKIDKAALALFTAVACWTMVAIGHVLPNGLAPDEAVIGHLGDVASIIFFLMGAMAIVELIDAHKGFELITRFITTTEKWKLLVIFSLVTFFMSAVLDNLTTAIVMATLLRKLVKNKQDLLLFAGMIVIAANAGGAFSPIGDVTTIMLWIGDRITTVHILARLFIPSLVCLLIPTLFMSFKLKGKLQSSAAEMAVTEVEVTPLQQRLVFFVGVGALLFVPVFKTITHLPPFLGILLGVSVMGIVTELMHRNKPGEIKRHQTLIGVLTRIDMSGILFFLGILLAVSALQSAGHLAQLAGFLNHDLGNYWLINGSIGILSSIVDNVPLVAGTMGMYSLAQFPTDHVFWDLLAYCAGTGGSILIIGSAAGVAIMGILKVDFIWYLKNVTLPAFLGYIGGMATLYLLTLL